MPKENNFTWNTFTLWWPACISYINPLKAKNKLHSVQIFSSYRTVNAFRVGYKDKLATLFFSDTYQKNINTLYWEERKVL
jgi:hypothetical protein